LGLPWIRKHNPVIDWQTGVLYFHMNKEHLQATYDDKLKLPEELKEYEDVFQPYTHVPEHSEYDIKIEFEEGAKIERAGNIYLTPKQKEEAKRQINEWS
jgi:hypothetical protein